MARIVRRVAAVFLVLVMVGAAIPMLHADAAPQGVDSKGNCRNNTVDGDVPGNAINCEVSGDVGGECTNSTVGGDVGGNARNCDVDGDIDGKCQGSLYSGTVSGKNLGCKKKPV